MTKKITTLFLCLSVIVSILSSCKQSKVVLSEYEEVGSSNIKDAASSDDLEVTDSESKTAVESKHTNSNSKSNPSKKESTVSIDDTISTTSSIYPVKTGRSAEKEAYLITNIKTTNAVNGANPKIASDVYQFAYDENNAFMHQSSICVFKNKIYAAWSSGAKNEDDEGQRIVLSSTPISNFKGWSKPKVVASPEMGLNHTKVLLNGEMWTDGDKLYISYFSKELASNMYNSDGTRKFTGGVEGGEIDYLSSEYLIMESTDGVNWKKTGSVYENTGWYCENNAFNRLALDGCPTSTINDATHRGAPFLGECYVYRGANNVLHLMARANQSKAWSCTSFDNGETWSLAYQTNFNTDATMATFGNLPDGRAFFIGSTKYGNSRYPLSLYVSKDGYNFDLGFTLRDERYVMKKDGWAKGGEYAYADFTFDNTYLYTIYSKQKEVAEITRVKLSDIK